MKKKILVCLLILFSLLIWPKEEKETVQPEKKIEVKQPKAAVPKEKTKVVKKEFTAYKDVPLSEEEQIHMQKICKELNICYEFALAMIESESNYQADAVGDHGRSVGYFQINKAQWNRLKEEYGLDPFNPKDNLECGIRIIWELFEEHGSDPYLVILMYKAGESRGKELYNQDKYVTNQYDCFEIMKRTEELERTHGK